MMYKTICLSLLEQRPQLYDQLQTNRQLLPTLNRLSAELKALHQAWIQELQATRPGSDTQIASEAMELALADLQDRLPADSETEAQAFLDEAMAFLRHTPPA
ncbi:MAG TPA: hypothetical protein VH592_13485 [Gemmataceae bacterium]